MRPLVIVGPSGVGKGTLIAKIQEGFAGAFLHNGTWDGKHALRGSISTVILTKYYTSQCADNSVFWILSRVSRVFFLFQRYFTSFVRLPNGFCCRVCPSTGRPLTHGLGRTLWLLGISHHAETKTWRGWPKKHGLPKSDVYWCVKTEMYVWWRIYIYI